MASEMHPHTHRQTQTNYTYTYNNLSISHTHTHRREELLRRLLLLLVVVVHGLRDDAGRVVGVEGVGRLEGGGQVQQLLAGHGVPVLVIRWVCVDGVCVRDEGCVSVVGGVVKGG